MIISTADRLGEVKEYYFSKKLKEIRSMNAAGDQVINLGIGSPDLPPSNDTINELCAVAKNSDSHGYQSYTGIPELRKKISSWLNKFYQIDLNPSDEILPLMGSKEGIMHISMTFLNKGDKVLVPNPGYPTYSSVSKLVEADIETYDLSEEKDWNIDLDSLKSKNLDSVKLMWINFPNMPTGANPKPEVLSELITLAKKHKFLIVNDNPYSLILTKSNFSIFQINGAKEVCLELNSLSKSHNMAGWRIGWLSGDASYLSEVLKVKSNMDSGMFLGLQRAAIKALDHEQRWHDEQNTIYQDRKAKILELYGLLGVSSDPENTGMFVWGKLPEEIESAEKFIDNILHICKVFITPGFIFGSNGERYIRASLCANVHTIDLAIDRIKKGLKL